jgi:hypothetical protein
MSDISTYLYKDSFECAKGVAKGSMHSFPKTTAAALERESEFGLGYATFFVAVLHFRHELAFGTTRRNQVNTAIRVNALFPAVE